MVESLVSKKIIPPKFKYSQMVKAGAHYYSSGMIGLDNETGQLVTGGVGKETEEIFKNLKILMAEFDLHWTHLAFARVFTSDFESFPEFNAVWESVLNEANEPPPARSSVGVSALPLNATVEIEFTFYKDD